VGPRIDAGRAAAGRLHRRRRWRCHQGPGAPSCAGEQPSLLHRRSGRIPWRRARRSCEAQRRNGRLPRLLPNAAPDKEKKEKKDKDKEPKEPKEKKVCTPGPRPLQAWHVLYPLWRPFAAARPVSAR
jgi:hypothetical protein